MRLLAMKLFGSEWSHTGRAHPKVYHGNQIYTKVVLAGCSLPGHSKAEHGLRGVFEGATPILNTTQKEMRILNPKNSERL